MSQQIVVSFFCHFSLETCSFESCGLTCVMRFFTVLLPVNRSRVDMLSTALLNRMDRNRILNNFPLPLGLFALCCRFHKSFRETSLPMPSHSTCMAQRWVCMSLNVTPTSFTSPALTWVPLTNHNIQGIFFFFLLSKIDRWAKYISSIVRLQCN